MHHVVLIVLLAACAPKTAPHPAIVRSDRTVAFADRVWWMREADVPTGAGPSRWSAAQDAVHVDDGRLCLALTEREGAGYGAEVLTPWPRRRPVDVELEPLGFDLDAAPEVVIGVFLYKDHGDELDAEWSVWGEPGAAPFQFVAPPATEGRRQRLEGPAPHRIRMQWRRRGPTFGIPERPRSRWAPSLRLPGMGRWFLHVNLWTMDGAAPSLSDVRVCVRAVR